MQDNARSIAIVGGGAAGIAAAISAAEEANKLKKDISIALFEADDRIGRPILATGNGRCNFSNANIDPRVYNNPVFVGEALNSLEEACREYDHRQYSNAVLGVFASPGLLWGEESEGRLYPMANKASSVLDVLRATVSANRIDVICSTPIVNIEAPLQPDKPYTLKTKDQAFERAHSVI
ncbi:MAG: NAD(P)/FAD-dependent oxidoreductase, partial [Eggerthellaceae bacterium]|nr:NAD(P)/FAD-dependent oxidoreductase [Eggerthellaceae bacterium]